MLRLSVDLGNSGQQFAAPKVVPLERVALRGAVAKVRKLL
jgi:hypothetical protein